MISLLEGIPMSLDAQLAAIRLQLESKSKNANIPEGDSETRDLSQNTVTKSNALSRAYYRLSLTEKRCMESLISRLHPLRSDNQLQDIDLLVTDYAKAFPDSGKNAYQHLESAADSLMNRVITINNPDCDADREKLTLMARTRYVKKQGKITCTFNPLIVPHLIGMRQRFNSYPLHSAVNFSSSYTWRLYEILVSWAKPKSEVGGRFMGWIDRQNVDELRGMLGVPDSYSWSKFDKQVLCVAQDELRKKSGLQVKFERRKTGRKITHLNINFIEDDQQQLPLQGGSIS